jgi:hypothetical protein
MRRREGKSQVAFIHTDYTAYIIVDETARRGSQGG